MSCHATKMQSVGEMFGWPNDGSMPWTSYKIKNGKLGQPSTDMVVIAL
jgi:hypothetical protein